jgi:CRP-like cAMP-binding protein
MKVCRNYANPCTGWFFLDVGSCLPIGYVEQILEATQPDAEQTTGSSSVKLLKILRLLRLAKLLRLGKIKKLMQTQQETFEELVGTFEVFLVLLGIIYACHLAACMWYFVGGDESDPETGVVVQGWITQQTNDVWNSTGTAESISLGARYLASFHWAVDIITTIGLGDISGHTSMEQMYTIAAELLSCLLYAKVIGLMGASMIGQQLLDQHVKKQITELREFMQAKQVPQHLRRPVRRYMENFYRFKSGFDEQQMLGDLPPKMAEGIMEHIYRDIVQGAGFLSQIENQDALLHICGKLKPRKVLKSGFVYRPGERGQEVYIIVDEGEVEVSFAKYEDETHQAKHKGDMLGAGCLRELFEKRSAFPYRYNTQAVAKSDCELKTLTVEDLREICQKYPEVKDTLRQYYEDNEKIQTEGTFADCQHPHADCALPTQSHSPAAID